MVNTFRNKTLRLMCNVRKELFGANHGYILSVIVHGPYSNFHELFLNVRGKPR